MMSRLVEQVHTYLGERLAEGDCVIDATLGNGHDTVFLARQVGTRGQVIALDVQAAALSQACRTMEAAGIADRLDRSIRLIEGSHAELERWVKPVMVRPPRAVVFNLGYLPGGDKAITTTADTTRQAFEASLKLLDSGGVLCALVYTGHPAGEAEYSMLACWVDGLDRNRFEPKWRSAFDPERRPPVWLTVEKR